MQHFVAFCLLAASFAFAASTTVASNKMIDKVHRNETVSLPKSKTHHMSKMNETSSFPKNETHIIKANTGRQARQLGYGGQYAGLQSALQGISSGYGYGYNNAVGLGGLGANQGYGLGIPLGLGYGGFGR